jgi:hypothetical protein
MHMQQTNRRGVWLAVSTLVVVNRSALRLGDYPNHAYQHYGLRIVVPATL